VLEHLRVLVRDDLRELDVVPERGEPELGDALHRRLVRGRRRQRLVLVVVLLRNGLAALELLRRRRALARDDRGPARIQRLLELRVLRGRAISAILTKSHQITHLLLELPALALVLRLEVVVLRLDALEAGHRAANGRGEALDVAARAAEERVQAALDEALERGGAEFAAVVLAVLGDVRDGRAREPERDRGRLQRRVLRRRRGHVRLLHWDRGRHRVRIGRGGDWR
jgi:hypothetical protein